VGVLFEFLVALLWEILLQIVFNFVADLGIESLRHAARREGKAHPIWAAFGHFFMGLIAGALSLLVVRHRMAAPYLFPGLSLILAPLGNGVAMHTLGEWWRRRGRPAPVLFTFRAGVLFAGGMQLMRVLYFR
jgi:hypothetical protein